ncbi:MAG: tetratricopeptide repeat protein [Bacteroidetes bacterium]|nr:tetratricopeptide repeat protein [Bacteroidota bacterium]
MKSRMTILLSFLCIISSQAITAQDSIKTHRLDSALRTIKDSDKKVDLILEFLEKPENQYLVNAVDLANRALVIAQKNNYASGKIRSMIKLGNSYFRSSDYKKAMEFAQKSKEMSEDLNFDKELANSLSLIGTIYSELDDFDNSSPCFFKSLELFEKLKDKEGISHELGSIGIDFFSLQEYKKALEYYNKSLSIALEINSQSSIKMQYNNIACVYECLQKYDTAIVFLRKALAINNMLGDKLGQGINILNIGYDQMNNGKFDDALLSFQQSLALFTGLNNRIHMAECYINLGFCYHASNRLDESIVNFKKALTEGQKNEYYRIVASAAKILNQIYTGKKDTLNAYKYLVFEKQAGDSLFASKQQKLLSKFELQYIYEKKEFERQQKQKAKNILILTLVFCLIAGLIILGLVFSRLRLKSKLVVIEKEKIELAKEKLESELNIKNKELTVNLISLIKKNEMLSDLSSEMVKLEINAKGKETKDAIAKIQLGLRNKTDDNLLNEFSQRFQEVHAGFYEKLLSVYPDLTQNDLKLCAFLRLNMSTKDIAELTRQELNTVAKARHRLRKKLEISGSDTNLVTFLSQI